MFGKDHTIEIELIKEELKEIKAKIDKINNELYLIDYKFENLRNNVKNVLDHLMDAYNDMLKLIDKEEKD